MGRGGDVIAKAEENPPLNTLWTIARAFPSRTRSSAVPAPRGSALARPSCSGIPGTARQAGRIVRRRRRACGPGRGDGSPTYRGGVDMSMTYAPDFGMCSICRLGDARNRAA